MAMSEPGPQGDCMRVTAMSAPVLDVRVSVLEMRLASLEARQPAPPERLLPEDRCAAEHQMTGQDGCGWIMACLLPKGHSGQHSTTFTWWTEDCDALEGKSSA